MLRSLYICYNNGYLGSALYVNLPGLSAVSSLTAHALTVLFKKKKMLIYRKFSKFNIAEHEWEICCHSLLRSVGARF